MNPRSHPSSAIPTAALATLALACGAPECIGAGTRANALLTVEEWSIQAASGTIEFLGPWMAESFSEAQDSLGGFDSAFDGPGFTATTFAVVTLANAAATADSLAPSHSAEAHVDLSGAGDSSARATGLGSLFSAFRLAGGTPGETVAVTFSVRLDNFLEVETDILGVLAEAETVFSLELDGNPLLFHHDGLSIGPNDYASLAGIGTRLEATSMLQFGTDYRLFAQADAETRAIAIPEANARLAAVVLLGLLPLSLWIRRHGDPPSPPP